jgi:hypothetical protein
LKLKKTTMLLIAAAALAIVLIIVGLQVMYSATEKAYQQTIQFENYRFDGSSSLVSGKSYYLGGGPQISLSPGDTIEIRAIHPPAAFNGSLSHIYFAAWESTPENTSAPDQLIQATALPATHIVKTNQLFFQLISDESLQNLAPGYSWTADFAYPYKIPGNPRLFTTGTAAMAAGITIAVLASYRFVKTSKSPRARSVKPQSSVKMC